MRVADLDYELPKELIAARPPAERDGGRLLVVQSSESGLRLIDSEVRLLPDFLPPRALVVVNDTRVVSARLLGRKVATGGRVELFVLRPVDGQGEESRDPSLPSRRFKALSRASKPLREGARIEIGTSGLLVATIASARVEDEREIEIVLTTSDGSPVDEAIEAEGHVPLPPYIDRADDDSDKSRYQTVFARVPGAVAAPTAGFHFSERMVKELGARETEIAAVTLHVGLGTFAPVTALDLDDHAMHEERFTVSEETAQAVRAARQRNARVVAIGTTVVRALESAADHDNPGQVRAAAGSTKILIQPGYKFMVVDHLLTNFHLPRSTLLALVAAFVGRETALAAYEHAVKNRYRFFSYGDAMLLTRASSLGPSELP